MTKKILEKITQKRTFLSVADISAEEKKDLLLFLTEKGFTNSTFYLRFFQKGFSEWEIVGIKECKKQFLELPDVAEALLAYVDKEDDTALEGDKGYYYTLSQSDDPGVFYDCIRKVNGLCTKFHSYMNDMGMSVGTTVKRFREENWKLWEVQGIKSVLEEYCSQEK